MRPISIRTLAGLVLTTGMALALVGCKGSTGSAGLNGTNGTNGTNGKDGSNGNNGTTGAYYVDAAALTADQWVNLNPVGTITSVSLTGGQPVVNFKITDANGFGVKNLDTFTQQPTPTSTIALPNFSFYIAKLVAADATTGAPSKWVSYMVTSVPSTTTGTSKIQAPNAESRGGVLKGNGDGTYTYTFYTDISKAAGAVTAAAGSTDVSALGDTTVEPNAPHRMVIEFYGNARGYGLSGHYNTADGQPGPADAELNTPINMIYDFVPATGLAPATTDTHREIVNLATCNTCHTKFNYHGRHRVDPKGCVTCHTDQRRFGSVEAVRSTDNTTFTGDTHEINGTAELDFPQLVHKIHMGDSLQMTGYDFYVDSNIPSQNAPYVVDPNPTGTAPNWIRYPQSVANCATCHVNGTSTPDAGNWNVNPSRVACGACHDQVDFVTGLNHGPTNLIQTSDKDCAGCHNPSSSTSGSFIATYHTPVTPVDPNNAGVPTAVSLTNPRAFLGNSADSNTNSSSVAGNQANLPTGAAPITWKLLSVSTAPGTTSGTVITWTFSILNGTTPVKLNPGGASYSYATHPELMDGFVGGPTLVLAYAAPQDGISAPNDYTNKVTVALRTLWRGGVVDKNGVTIPGNVVTDNGDGTYTATYNQATVPATAGMLTGGIGYAYGVVTQTALYGDPGDGTSAHKAVAATPAVALTDKLPLTQVNLAAYPFGAPTATVAPLPYQGGLSVVAPNVWTMAANQTARRAIVDGAKCATCHENLGVFTDSVFHAGQRNNAETCNFCHNQNSMDAGWSYNIKEAIHSLHASSKRMTPYTWQSGHTYWNTTYPALLNNCEACHVPGSYDLSANASQVPNMLWSTVATGTPAGTVLTDPTKYDPTATYISPFVTSGTNYGAAISYNTGLTAKTNVPWPSFGTATATIASLAAGTAVEADPTTLVNSPITSACFACHDSSTAAAHMKSNGGYLAVPRSMVVTVAATTTGTTVTSPILNSEACLTCHGTGQIADIKAVHATF